MAIVTRYKGDDIPLLLGLTDENGDAINIDNLAELYVYVRYKRDRSTLASFSKAGTGMTAALTKVSTTVYRADIKSSITKAAATWCGVYDVDINVVQTDAGYESSQKNTIGIEDVFYLGDSTSKIKSSGT